MSKPSLQPAPVAWLKWERLASPYLYCLPRHVTSKNMAYPFYNYLGWTFYHSNLEHVRHLSCVCVCITVRFAPNSFSKAERLTTVSILNVYFSIRLFCR